MVHGTLILTRIPNEIINIYTELMIQMNYKNELLFVTKIE